MRGVVEERKRGGALLKLGPPRDARGSPRGWVGVVRAWPCLPALPRLAACLPRGAAIVADVVRCYPCPAGVDPGPSWAVW